MGDGEKAAQTAPSSTPKSACGRFHGVGPSTFDAGLRPSEKLDDALDLGIASSKGQESGRTETVLQGLVPLLRQSIYSRLAGYDDTNDAVRLSKEPCYASRRCLFRLRP